MQVTPKGLGTFEGRAFFFFSFTLLYYQCIAHSRHLINDSLIELTSIRREDAANFNKQSVKICVYVYIYIHAVIKVLSL